MAMLYNGSLIAVGTKEELQSSSHPRIRQFLDRVPDRAFQTASAHQFIERYLEGGQL
jgi:ABC-type transporter Mla maintaining outer membrane lipid asymmetry ATPase subunit MlaF